MLKELSYFTQNIHAISKPKAKKLYARAMSVAVSVGDALDDLLTDAGRAELPARLFEYAFAAQEFAYAYVLHHGEPIHPGAIDPESFDHVLVPPGHSQPVLSGAELRIEIIKFLRKKYPLTIPAEMRE